MLKVLAAIQVRSRGEWRNLLYFATSPAFRHREVQKDCPNRKREIGVYATLNLSIPKDCILSITVFHVSMVLTEGREGGERELIYCPPCFCKVSGREGIWNPESGMRNSQPISFLWKF